MRRRRPLAELSPAQVEELMLGLVYSVRDTLMNRHDMRERQATDLALSVVQNLRRDRAGECIEFPPLAPAQTASC